MKCLVTGCEREATESAGKYSLVPWFCKPCLTRLLSLKDSRPLSREEALRQAQDKTERVLNKQREGENE